MAENYLQHAEHYNRIIMEHFRHRPHEGKTILAVYGGRKLNGFAVNSKRFLASALIKIA
ncbi:DUF4167 domain-containing protein, partial [Brucella melitensis]|nr:DUF4167 domain-containing protein [Brucella melitensis]